jgi:hypothetical protein
VRILGYFSKPQRGPQAENFGNTNLEEHIPNEHVLIEYIFKKMLFMFDLTCFAFFSHGQKGLFQ